MKTNNELSVLADKRGWKIGPLTYADIRKMGSDEALFHERLNKPEYERALAGPQVQAANKKNAEASKAQRLWAEQATPEETEVALQEVTKFCARYPQFIGSFVPNREALITFLKSNNQPITFSTLVQAFEELTQNGSLLLSPAAIGAGPEEEIGGHKLKTYPYLYKLLEPVLTAEEREKRQKKRGMTAEEEKMSAEQYRNSDAHKADFRETSISHRQQQDWNKAIGLFLQSRPEYARTEENQKKMNRFISANGLQVSPQGLEAAFQALKAKNELELNKGAVQQGQAVSYTNLAHTVIEGQSGFVANDTNLTAKIAKMSADDYSRWLQSPSNRKAANELALGKARA
jgi:hypothetical protein